MKEEEEEEEKEEPTFMHCVQPKIHPSFPPSNEQDSTENKICNTLDSYMAIIVSTSVPLGMLKFDNRQKTHIAASKNSAAISSEHKQCLDGSRTVSYDPRTCCTCKEHKAYPKLWGLTLTQRRTEETGRHYIYYDIFFTLQVAICDTKLI